MRKLNLDPTLFRNQCLKIRNAMFAMQLNYIECDEEDELIDLYSEVDMALFDLENVLGDLRIAVNALEEASEQ